MNLEPFHREILKLIDSDLNRINPDCIENDATEIPEFVDNALLLKEYLYKWIASGPTTSRVNNMIDESMHWLDTYISELSVELDNIDNKMKYDLITPPEALIGGVTEEDIIKQKNRELSQYGFLLSREKASAAKLRNALKVAQDMTHKQNDSEGNETTNTDNAPALGKLDNQRQIALYYFYLGRANSIDVNAVDWASVASECGFTKKTSARNIKYRCYSLNAPSNRIIKSSKNISDLTKVLAILDSNNQKEAMLLLQNDLDACIDV